MSKDANRDTKVTPHGLSQPTDVLLIYKKSTRMFVITELCVYASQVLMFFFVAVLTSNLLRDEKQLLSYMTSKVNENTTFEVFATMMAIAATLGIIAGIARAAPETSLLERLADEVLAEAPRTAYVFGSGVSGTLFAVALYIHWHPEVQSPPVAFWLFAAIFSALIGFMYGCLFAYAFKHKAHIKASSHASSYSKNAP
jgi:CDP-diglyceride synthetase